MRVEGIGVVMTLSILSDILATIMLTVKSFRGKCSEYTAVIHDIFTNTVASECRMNKSLISLFPFP